MGKQSDRAENSETERPDTRDELRTIGFRLRELQRLLSMRVQQENRRLDAEGIDPIRDATFFKQSEGHQPASQNAIRYLIETLGGLDVFQKASITLADGTTIQGRVNPITYSPRERLRVEIRPPDEDARYELHTEYTDDRWDTPVIRRYVSPDDDWTELGEVNTMRTLE